MCYGGMPLVVRTARLYYKDLEGDRAAVAGLELVLLPEGDFVAQYIYIYIYRERERSSLLYSCIHSVLDLFARLWMDFVMFLQEPNVP